MRALHIEAEISIKGDQLLLTGIEPQQIGVEVDQAVAEEMSSLKPYCLVALPEIDEELHTVHENTSELIQKQQHELQEVFDNMVEEFKLQIDTLINE